MSTISNKEETWPLPVEWDRKPLGVILKALSSMESLATRIPESYTVSSSKKTWDSFTNFQKRKILKCWHKCPEDKKRQVMNITSQNTTVLPPYDDFNSDDFARLIHMNVDSKFADILRRIADVSFSVNSLTPSAVSKTKC